MAESDQPAARLLTIAMVLDKFPAEGRPSARLVRLTAQRLNIGRRWGRTYYLTEAEAERLILAGSQRKHESTAPLIRPPKYKSEAQRKLERDKKLEKLGLK